MLWWSLPSVQFSHLVVSDSLGPHESQHARPPCPSPTPRVYPNSCALCQWCHPAISSSVVPFSSCPQSLPASESFPMNQLFAWGGQSIGVSASASVLPMNTQDWSPLGWTGWLTVQSKGLSRVFSNTTVQKHQFFDAQLSSQSNSHIHTWSLVSAIHQCKSVIIIFLPSWASLPFHRFRLSQSARLGSLCYTTASASSLVYTWSFIYVNATSSICPSLPFTRCVHQTLYVCISFSSLEIFKFISTVEFSRQEYWSGLPFPSPGDLPDPGKRSPALQADTLPSEPPWSLPYISANLS